MHDDRVLLEERIARELDERVRPRRHRHATPLRVEAWHAPGEPVPHHDAVDQRFEPFAVGGRWGRPWGTTWFRLTGEVPDGWAGPTLEAVVDLGFHDEGAGFQAEGLVWLDGEPVQGVHPRRTAVSLPELATGSFSLLVEAAANPIVGPGFRPTPMGSLATAPDRLLYRLKRADLAVLDPVVDGLVHDVDVLRGVMRGLALDDPRRIRLLHQLVAAFDRLDLHDVAGTAAAARDALAPALAVPARPSSLRVIAVGHAHIDTAWLWPLRETVRKCASTFASAVRLMDDDPDYRFVCSQAVQYAWMEERYPSLFERIAAKVADGRFVPVGGMWVEADMNLPSGESIARQMIHGQRYFESRFGVRCAEVWIPDVFGYPATLPQIFRAGGAERFVTQKLSWNQQNRFPHHTFWWEGVDGSRVLTHFPPVDTYNAEVTGEELAFSERNFREHAWSDWALMPYGYGNGGGGPTREMVARAHRVADLDGAPRVELGTPERFFEHVEAEAAAGAPVPVWRGELYFEMHRGTLTSQIETKVGNRRCERLLREAELWWAAGGAVPDEVAAELDALWKAVLVQQFHDILPGSSIAWVHADAEREHARVASRLGELIDAAVARLDLTGPAVLNAATHPRRAVLALPDGLAVAGDGPTQQLADGATAAVVEVTGSGHAPLVARPEADVVTVDGSTMANGRVALRWDDDGALVSICDLERDREVLPPGERVALELAADHPVNFDAWDLESWTPPQGAPLDGPATVEVIDAGPLVGRVRVTRPFERSVAVTDYVVRAGSARVDVELDVDWHADERLLSLRVPLDVRTDAATCGVQLGWVRRPTHPSSPWDAAKFEVCAHRYVDVSEPSFGVGVLTDGRWGHGLFDGGVRVSILRATKYPDPDADHGRHRTTVALLPHGPGLHEVLAEAEALDVPLRVVGDGEPATAPTTPTAPSGSATPVVAVDHPGVWLMAVKRADDGSGDLVVRLHEAAGDRARVTVRPGEAPSRAWTTNLLEERLADGPDLSVVDGGVVLDLRPCEMVTLRLGG